MEMFQHGRFEDFLCKILNVGGRSLTVRCEKSHIFPKRINTNIIPSKDFLAEKGICKTNRSHVTKSDV